jgi:aerotaxis receptor
MDFKTAIGQHLAWMVNLRVAVSQRERLEAPHVSRDDSCQLGAWLQAEGKRAHGGHPAYPDLLSHHAAFHKETGRLVDLLNQGRYDEVEVGIGLGSEFGRLSNRVRNSLRTVMQS